MAFHLVLFWVRATIRVVVLVLCSNVLAIGLARLVFVHGLQTCRVSDFCFFFVFFSPAWYCVVILATVGRETVVFRLLPSSVESCPVFHNRSQRRRDVISLALLFALSSPWKGPLELYLFSVTLGLALRLNRLKVCPFFWFSAWAAHSAPSLVDICRASVFLSVS